MRGKGREGRVSWRAGAWADAGFIERVDILFSVDLFALIFTF